MSTHENPSVVFWEPLTRQTQFHRRRFEVFSGYVPLVADCSHWWINVIDTMFSTFPTAKAIGVRREMEDCLRSWMKVSPQDLNHRVAPYNHIWLTDRWDPLYPHCEMPLAAKRDRRGAKADLVRRYVSDYNRRLGALAAGPGWSQVRLAFCPAERHLRAISLCFGACRIARGRFFKIL